jgi:hypothetical protein
VLAVVDNKQQLPVHHRHRQQFWQWLLAALVHAEGMSHGVGNQRRIVERRELDPGHAIGEVFSHFGGHGQRKPSLANPAWTGQGQQSPL